MQTKGEHISASNQDARQNTAQPVIKQYEKTSYMKEHMTND